MALKWIEEVKNNSPYIKRDIGIGNPLEGFRDRTFEST